MCVLYKGLQIVCNEERCLSNLMEGMTIHNMFSVQFEYFHDNTIVVHHYCLRIPLPNVHICTCTQVRHSRYVPALLTWQAALSQCGLSLCEWG